MYAVSEGGSAANAFSDAMIVYLLSCQETSLELTSASAECPGLVKLQMTSKHWKRPFCGPV